MTNEIVDYKELNKNKVIEKPSHWFIFGLLVMILSFMGYNAGQKYKINSLKCDITEIRNEIKDEIKRLDKNDAGIVEVLNNHKGSIDRQSELMGQLMMKNGLRLP